MKRFEGAFKMGQQFLFEKENNTEIKNKEWIGMPEFVQEKKNAPYSKIIVRFETKEDMLDFSKIIGQKLTNKTKSIWHPKFIIGLNSNKVYCDES